MLKQIPPHDQRLVCQVFAPEHEHIETWKCTFVPPFCKKAERLFPGSV
ncbi:MAG: hypothetical protein ABSH50_30815 [Bryobacteraceae bacterium]